MEHYVTIFDSLFAPQGLTLQRSMENYAGKYTLWIVCVDDDIYDRFRIIDLPNVELLKLSELETVELKKVKSHRSIAEYCWTLTPFAISFVFNADTSVGRVTYIDADLWFMGSPREIFNEFDNSGKNVLITEHAYSPEYDQSRNSGKFCVQFLIFKRNKSEIVRNWWEKQCIDWCYARFENGKFGDQKYLDDWPERFGNDVHVLRNKELILAPWNARRFPYSSSLIYHFHGLRLLANNEALISGNYLLPRPLVKFVYGKYIEELNNSVTILIVSGWKFRPQSKKPSLIRIIAWPIIGIFQAISFNKILKIK